MASDVYIYKYGGMET